MKNKWQPQLLIMCAAVGTKPQKVTTIYATHVKITTLLEIDLKFVLENLSSVPILYVLGW